MKTYKNREELTKIIKEFKKKYNLDYPNVQYQEYERKNKENI